METNLIEDLLRGLIQLIKPSVFSFIKDVIPIVISGISLFITIIMTLNIQKENQLNNIKNNIDTAKNRIIETSSKFSKFTNDRNKRKYKNEINFLKSIIAGQTEILFNCYEDACYKFDKKQINRNDFLEKYKKDIITEVEKNPDIFENPLCTYDRILNFYKQNK